MRAAHAGRGQLRTHQRNAVSSTGFTFRPKRAATMSRSFATTTRPTTHPAGAPIFASVWMDRTPGGYSPRSLRATRQPSRFFAPRACGSPGTTCLRSAMAWPVTTASSSPDRTRRRTTCSPHFCRWAARHGLRRGGSRSYFSSNIESGWIGYPLPADLQRGGTSALSRMASCRRLGGKLPDGRQLLFAAHRGLLHHALRSGLWRRRSSSITTSSVVRRWSGSRRKAPRSKVTFAWNREDVSAVFDSYLEGGSSANTFDGRSPIMRSRRTTKCVRVRASAWAFDTLFGYSINEREQLSLAIVDKTYAQPGTELVLIWGEPGGGSRKPQVERHRQTEIRVTVAPVPYAKSATQMKKATLAPANERLPPNLWITTGMTYCAHYTIRCAKWTNIVICEICLVCGRLSIS